MYLYTFRSLVYLNIPSLLRISSVQSLLVLSLGLIFGLHSLFKNLFFSYFVLIFFFFPNSTLVDARGASSHTHSPY